jgi:hypothetical protein
MKTKLIAAFLAITLIAGCAFLQTVQDKVCNPPQAVIDVVSAASPLISVAVGLAVPGSEEYITAVALQAAATAILAGTCVTLTQLNNLIAWFQSDKAKSLAAKMAMAKIGPVKAALLDPAPLIAWRDSQTK